MDDNERQPKAKDHLNDSGDLKMKIIIRTSSFALSESSYHNQLLG